MNSMENLEKEILKALLDKYQNSKLSKEGTKINRVIKLTEKDKSLSSFFGVESHSYLDRNNLIIDKLKKKSFITPYYNEYGRFEYLTLNIEKVDEIYTYLGINNPKDEVSKVKEVISKYHFDNFINDFINYINSFIDKNYKYPSSYFKDSEELDLLLKTFTFLIPLEEEMKIRDFSVKYLNDSKIFENVQNKVIRILKEYSGNTYNSDEEILPSFNIIKNKSYVFIKNNLAFKLNNQIIDLNKLGFEYALSDNMLKQIEILPSSFNKVISVENLTTFNDLNEKDALIIYLAGFHNHTKEEFLKLIFRKFPNVSYYHFSDIDAGGFRIFVNLKNKTNIPFIPYKMSIKELKDNKDHLKELTDNDKKALTGMLNNKDFDLFKETIEYMLNNNVKLEQEILD